MDSPAEEDGFEPSVPREKDGEKADESISQLSLAGSVNAAGTRCLHFGKMRVQANGNSYLHGHRWGLGRNVTGSSQRSPLYAAETPRCLHFGKNARASKRQLVPSRTSVGSRGAKGKLGPRNVTGSSQRSPLYAAETPRCLHFGKCACKQAATRFPPTKERRARPTQMADKIIMRAVEA
jgi:hypothetical protein